MTPYTPRGTSSRFWNWLASVPPESERLAWCHTTDGWRLRQMVQAGLIPVAPCNVFREDLVYFFYGRPAFRRNEEAQLRLSCRSPVVLVLEPELCANGRRMFPFDSGAFANDMYRQWLHPKMELADFEIGRDGSAPLRHVSAFFGTASNYLHLKAKAPDVPYSGEFEVESIVSILSDQSSEEADDRRLAMELQVPAPIPFDSGAVLAVIVPEDLLRAPWLQEYMGGAGAGIDFVPYEAELLRKTAHYQVKLEEKVHHIQQMLGLIA